MVAAGDGSSPTALSQKRAQFAGPGGVKGLLTSSYVFLIAVFASLGGFVYGCESLLLMLTLEICWRYSQIIKECLVRFLQCPHLQILYILIQSKILQSEAFWLRMSLPPFWFFNDYQACLLISEISGSSNWVLGLVCSSTALQQMSSDGNGQQLVVFLYFLSVLSSKPVPKMRITSLVEDLWLV
jgi:hypothetical protein